MGMLLLNALFSIIVNSILDQFTSKNEVEKEKAARKSILALVIGIIVMYI